jgi:hypothetical protein
MYGPADVDGWRSSGLEARDLIEDIHPHDGRTTMDSARSPRQARVGTARRNPIATIGPSGVPDGESRRMEHPAPPMDRPRGGRSVGEEGGTWGAKSRCRRAPNPGFDSSVAEAGRDRRRGGLSRAERPRAGAWTWGFRGGIGGDGQIVHQGIRQRQGLVLRDPGRDEM